MEGKHLSQRGRACRRGRSSLQFGTTLRLVCGRVKGLERKDGFLDATLREGGLPEETEHMPPEENHFAKRMVPKIGRAARMMKRALFQEKKSFAYCPSRESPEERKRRAVIKG